MSTTAVINNATGNSVSSSIRIATFAIAAYDFLQTIPGEYRLYRKQYHNRRISLICWLFIIVRYVSVVCLVLNGVGFYSTSFNQKSCAKFYLAPLFTKVVAGLASQGIIFRRTYAISHTRTTFITLWTISILIFPVQIFGNTYKRGPVVGTGFEKGNCAAKTQIGDFVSGPYYYLANLVFDVVACSIASWSLLRRSSVNGDLGLFGRKVLKHGVLYALGTTFTNFLVFLALMNVPVVKNLGAFLAVAVTMILAQRLVLATAGTSESSSEDSSLSWNTRERSQSREPGTTRSRRLTAGIPMSPTAGIVHTLSPNGRRFSNMTVTNTTSSRTGSSTPGPDRIDFGGIRVHTEVETHRHPHHGGIHKSHPVGSAPIDNMELLVVNDGKKMGGQRTITTPIGEKDEDEDMKIGSANTSMEDFVFYENEKRLTGDKKV